MSKRYIIDDVLLVSPNLVFGYRAIESVSDRYVASIGPNVTVVDSSISLHGVQIISGTTSISCEYICEYHFTHLHTTIVGKMISFTTRGPFTEHSMGLFTITGSVGEGASFDIRVLVWIIWLQVEHFILHILKTQWNTIYYCTILFIFLKQLITKSFLLKAIDCSLVPSARASIEKARAMTTKSLLFPLFLQSARQQERSPQTTIKHVIWPAAWNLLESVDVWTTVAPGTCVTLCVTEGLTDCRPQFCEQKQIRTVFEIKQMKSVHKII